MIDDCVAILHIKGSAFTIHHSCYSGIAIQRDSSRTIGNDITTDVDTSKLSSLICNNAVLGRDMTSCLNRPICSANADVVASRFPQENIIIQSNLINLLPVDFCFFYIDVAAIDNLAMLARFGCYCMELAAIYRISRVSGDCTCCYAGNLAVFSNNYFAQLSTFSSDLAVVGACIAYEQLAISQFGMTGEYAIFQNYVADFAFGCGYFAVFIYNQFAVGSIECAVAVYEERHAAVWICSTYGQVVFCIQCIGLDGVCTGNVAVFIDSYFAQLSTFSSDLAVVGACIAYEQLAISQFGMTGEYAIFQNYVADFAFGCGYFAVFIYNQFAVGSIECAVAVYEERHAAVWICSTYGQVVFCVQYIGLDGVCTSNVT